MDQLRVPNCKPLRGRSSFFKLHSQRIKSTLVVRPSRVCACTSRPAENLVNRHQALKGGTFDSERFTTIWSCFLGSGMLGSQVFSTLFPNLSCRSRFSIQRMLRLLRPSRKFGYCLGVWVYSHEIFHSLSVTPHRERPEPFVRQIGFQPISDQALRLFQLLLHLPIHLKEWDDVPPTPNG